MTRFHAPLMAALAVVAFFWMPRIPDSVVFLIVFGISAVLLLRVTTRTSGVRNLTPAKEETPRANEGSVSIPLKGNE